MKRKKGRKKEKTRIFNAETRTQEREKEETSKEVAKATENLFLFSLFD